MRCEKVDDLLSMVVELKEEGERLQSIREAEREIDRCDQALTSLRHTRNNPKHQYRLGGPTRKQLCRNYLVDNSQECQRYPGMH